VTAVDALEAEPAPRRRRLSRTLSRSRFWAYRSILQTAIGAGYEPVPLERFLDDPAVRELPRVFILRHDVDQHPASALEMSAIERSLGVTSTWYLRWRTADPDVIGQLRAAGGEIGLHYETLTRRVLKQRRAPDSDVSDLLEPCREELAGEIVAFRERFGALRSICAHGDTRAPWVRNLELVEGQPVEQFGVVHDANLAMRRHALGAWLTDRSSAEGSWGDGLDPYVLVRDGVSPIQCLTHPNNWVSGPGLWCDRVLSAVLPRVTPGAPARVTRTRSDITPFAAPTS